MKCFDDNVNVDDDDNDDIDVDEDDEWFEECVFLSVRV